MNLEQTRERERNSAAQQDRSVQARQAVEAAREQQSQYRNDSKVGSALDVRV